MLYTIFSELVEIIKTQNKHSFFQIDFEYSFKVFFLKKKGF